MRSVLQEGLAAKASGRASSLRWPAGESVQSATERSGEREASVYRSRLEARAGQLAAVLGVEFFTGSAESCTMMHWDNSICLLLDVGYETRNGKYAAFQTRGYLAKKIIS